MLKLINRDRALYNLPPVELDVDASAIGDEYCRTQIRNRTTGHFTIDGIAPYMRYSLAGGNDGVSENAAAWSATYTFSDRALYEMARRSQDAMMAEAPPNDGHKRTILDPHATHVGIGLAWERGEFRLVHEFVRRYVDWTPPAAARRARSDEPVIVDRHARCRASRSKPSPCITSRCREPIAAHVASAISTLRAPRRSAASTRRACRARRRRSRSRCAAISPCVPTARSRSPCRSRTGRALYTVVVWVRKDGDAHAVPREQRLDPRGRCTCRVRASAAGR